MYLRRHLPEWSAERAKAHDYRIMFLDAFEVHKCQEVTDLCWSRGFLVIPLGGGTTPIACWLDTDLHQPMSAGLQELEQLDFEAQLEQRPWRCPSRERQAIVDDSASWWYRFPHASNGQVAAMRTGFALALPQRIGGRVQLVAKDDNKITREARHYSRSEGGHV